MADDWTLREWYDELKGVANAVGRVATDCEREIFDIVEERVVVSGASSRAAMAKHILSQVRKRADEVLAVCERVEQSIDREAKPGR